MPGASPSTHAMPAAAGKADNTCWRTASTYTAGTVRFRANKSTTTTSFSGRGAGILRPCRTGTEQKASGQIQHKEINPRHKRSFNESKQKIGTSVICSDTSFHRLTSGTYNRHDFPELPVQIIIAKRFRRIIPGISPPGCTRLPRIADRLAPFLLEKQAGEMR